MLERFVIAVDGLAGSGKTTLSRLLAQKLGFAHLNSGALYRGVAWLAREHGVSARDVSALLSLLATHSLALQQNSNQEGRVIADGRDVTSEIGVPEISEMTSVLSQFQEVRKELFTRQRDAYPGANLVAEGRDMGTIVFPDAPLKFFIRASQAVRIDRRLRQLGLNPATADPNGLKALKRQIEMEIIERDERDSKRPVAPTVAAVDAVEVDNSAETLTDVLQTMYSVASHCFETFKKAKKN